MDQRVAKKERGSQQEQKTQEAKGKAEKRKGNRSPNDTLVVLSSFLCVFVYIRMHTSSRMPTPCRTMRKDPPEKLPEHVTTCRKGRCNKRQIKTT